MQYMDKTMRNDRGTKAKQETEKGGIKDLDPFKENVVKM